MAFPDGWTHKENFTATNTTSKSGAATWLMKLDLSTSNDAATLFGNMNADGSDIRVSTDEAGATTLSIAEWPFDPINTGANTGTIVVELTSPPGASASVSLWVWVGNSGAATVFDNSIYHLYEDFRDANHATVISNLGGDISETDGILMANWSGFTDGEIAALADVSGATEVREQSNIIKVGSTYYILVSFTESTSSVNSYLYTASDIEGPWTSQGKKLDLAEDCYWVVNVDGSPYTDGTYYYGFAELKQSASEDNQLGISEFRTSDFVTFEVWDGAAWTTTTANAATVLARGAASAWDEGTATIFLGSPVAFVESTTVYLLYEGWDSAIANFATGLATISTSNLSADPDQLAKSFTDGGPFSPGLEVMDDMRKIGSTYWFIGHDSGGNLRRYKTATAVASWATNSWSQDGWNPFEVSGGLSLNLAFDSTGDLDKYGTFSRAVNGSINVVLLVGGTKWRPVNFPDSNYSSAINRERDRQFTLDETNGYLTLEPPATLGVGITQSVGIATQNTPLPAVNFAIHAQMRTRDRSTANRNILMNISFGTGGPTEVTNNSHFPFISSGVQYSIFPPTSPRVNIREYDASAFVKNIDNDVGNELSDANIESFNEHALRFTDNGGTGLAAVAVGGTEYASGTPTNDLRTGAKNLMIGQAQREDDDGGISDWQYLVAIDYDGDDPTFTGQGVTAVATITGGAAPVTARSAQEILNSCFDPTNNILRLGTTGGDVAGNRQFSMQEIFNRVFNASSNILVTSGTGPGGSATEFSVQEILNRCFNATSNILVTSGTGPGGSATEFSVQEILNRVFDATNNAIVTSGTGPGASPTRRSVQEILNRCFDATNNALETAAG